MLFSKELEESLSLNHTAALLCSFADGQHTFVSMLQEMSQIFPESPVDAGALAACLRDLEARRFLRWG